MNNTETTFKQTDIGLIPEDWEIKKLEEASEIIMGQSPPSSTYNSNGNGLPFYQGKTDFGNMYPTPRIWCTSPSKIAEKNDILISVRAPVGPTNLSLEKSGIGRGLSAIRVKQNNYLFLYYFLKKIENEIEKLGTGSTFKAINKSQLHNIKIPLPPLPEQKKIAHVLSKIQQAIEIQEQIIKTTQELKKALMQKLFTEGLKGEPQKQSAVGGEIGPIPESWEVVTIGDVCEQRKENYSPNPDGNSIYVGLEHIVSGEFYLTNHSYENTVVSSKYKFYKDDLLYGKLRPYLDKAVIVNSTGICSTDIIVIKPKIDNNFLLSLLHSEKLLKHSIAHTSGVNHPRTSFDALSRFKFALPNPNEQKAIGNAIFKLEDKIISHQNYRVQLKDVFSSMLNQLMTGQIRVKDIEFNEIPNGEEHTPIPSREGIKHIVPLLRGNKGVCK